MLRHINERLIAPSLQFKNTEEKGWKEPEVREALGSHVIIGAYRWDSCYVSVRPLTGRMRTNVM